MGCAITLQRRYLHSLAAGLLLPACEPNTGPDERRADTVAPVVAFTGAQREMLRNAATADPFYWGGFVLVGGR